MLLGSNDSVGYGVFPCCDDVSNRQGLRALSAGSVAFMRHGNYKGLFRGLSQPYRCLITLFPTGYPPLGIRSFRVSVGPMEEWAGVLDSARAE